MGCVRMGLAYRAGPGTLYPAVEGQRQARVHGGALKIDGIGFRRMPATDSSASESMTGQNSAVLMALNETV